MTNTLSTAEQVCERPLLNCLFTGNPCGIDTMRENRACVCVVCQADALITSQAAEIERLTRELGVATSIHRWNTEKRPDGTFSICRNNHEKGAPCEWETFVPIDRAETVEASLAAVKAERDAMHAALEPFAKLSKMTPIMVGRGENTRHRNPSDEDPFDFHYQVTWGMLRAARAALSLDAQVKP